MRVLEVVSDANAIARILHGARAPPTSPVVRLDTRPTLTVATVHLESTVGMTERRCRQLAEVHSWLAPEDEVLLLGDMNFPTVRAGGGDLERVDGCVAAAASFRTAGRSGTGLRSPAEVEDTRTTIRFLAGSR